MMRKLIFAAAASVSLLALSGVAQAQGTSATNTTPSIIQMDDGPTSECGKTDHCWENWGSDPFAKSQAEFLTDAKLNKYLADVVTAGLPARLVPFIKADIKDHPNGYGPDHYFTPGMFLDMMESGHGPMFNVTVGKIYLGRGAVKAAETHEYAYYDAPTNTTYILDVPYATCNNGSLRHITRIAPVIPPQTHSDCFPIGVPLPEGGTVEKVTFEVFGPQKVTDDEACPLAGHPCDDCRFDDVEQHARDRGEDLGEPERRSFKPRHHRGVIIWVSRQILNHDRFAICLHFRKESDGLLYQSLSQVVHFDHPDTKHTGVDLPEFQLELAQVP